MYPTDLLVELFKKAKLGEPFVLSMFDPYETLEERKAIVVHVAQAAKLADRFTIVNWIDRKPVVKLRPLLRTRS